MSPIIDVDKEGFGGMSGKSSNRNNLKTLKRRSNKTCPESQNHGGEHKSNECDSRKPSASEEYIEVNVVRVNADDLGPL